MSAPTATATATATAVNNNIKTYRHEFGKEFMERLSRFSIIHQYSDRHTYKAEWTKWTQQTDIADAIDAEKRRLNENGYVGDIDDKMYKAGRYYFRKKNKNNKNYDDDEPATPATPATPAKEQQQQTRRAYITMSKSTITQMDNHLKEMHSTQAATFKPSTCYDNFYQTKMSSAEMTAEIEKIIDKFQKSINATSRFTPDELTTEIIDKIKKTYKNRYYKFVSQHNSE
jgi:hypothetical protein